MGYWILLGSVWLIALLLLWYFSKKEKGVFGGEEYKKLEAKLQTEIEKRPIASIEELKKKNVAIDDEKAKEIIRKSIRDLLRMHFRQLELNPNDLKFLITSMLEAGDKNQAEFNQGTQ